MPDNTGQDNSGAIGKCQDIGNSLIEETVRWLESPQKAALQTMGAQLKSLNSNKKFISEILNPKVRVKSDNRITKSSSAEAQCILPDSWLEHIPDAPTDRLSLMEGFELTCSLKQSTDNAIVESRKFDTASSSSENDITKLQQVLLQSEIDEIDEKAQKLLKLRDEKLFVLDKLKQSSIDKFEGTNLPTKTKHGSLLKYFQAFSSPTKISSVDFDHPLGTLFTTTIADENIYVYDISSGHLKSQLQGHKASIGCIYYSDSMLASASNDATVKLWNADCYSLLHTYNSHQREVTSVHFHDGKIASGSEDNTVHVHDINSSRLINILKIPNPRSLYSWSYQNDDIGIATPRCVGSLQCFENGLVSGSSDGVVRIWDMRTGKLHREYQSHSAAVTSVHFDTFNLVSASLDRSVRIWDIRMDLLSEVYAYETHILDMGMNLHHIACCTSEPELHIYDRFQKKQWTTNCSQDIANKLNLISMRLRDNFLIAGSDEGTICIFGC